MYILSVVLDVLYVHRIRRVVAKSREWWRPEHFINVSGVYFCLSKGYGGILRDRLSCQNNKRNNKMRYCPLNRNNNLLSRGMGE